MVWIKSANAATALGPLSVLPVACVYVPNLGHRYCLVDLAIWLPGRNGDGAGDTIASLILAASSPGDPCFPPAAVILAPPTAAIRRIEPVLQQAYNLN